MGQHEFQESDRATCERSKKTVSSAGWCALLTYQDAHEKKGKYEACLLSVFSFSWFITYE